MGSNILYIEDNPDNMMLVKRALESRGYTLIEAKNGLEGVVAGQHAVGAAGDHEGLVLAVDQEALGDQLHVAPAGVLGVLNEHGRVHVLNRQLRHDSILYVWSG